MPRPIPDVLAIQWDDAPPFDKGIWIPVYRPAWGAPVKVILLDDQIRGVWVHTVGKRDTPCAGDPRLCIPHCSRTRKRWKGYFPAIDPNSGRFVLPEITHDAWREWKTRKPDPIPIGRGAVLTVKRCWNAANARCSLEVTRATVIEALPLPFDVRAALHRLWAGDDKNVPLPTMVDAAAGDQ